MLRIINSLKTLTLQIPEIPANSVNINSVRWRRKPRKPIWKGTAKTKIFRVPVRPVIPQEEVLEIKRLYNKYRTEVKTITQFLTSKYNVQNLQKDDQDMKRKEYEADLEVCMKLNDEWNAKVRMEREPRVAAEVEQALEAAKRQKIATQERRVQRSQEAEEIVKKEKLYSKDFILPEMLDTAIENALANPVDYNFALDLEGNKIIGRESAPPPEKKTADVRQ